tara:strand:+ start:591 stop:722 length:132 start_codon:yes stop_codon:yes gene_type:complete
MEELKERRRIASSILSGGRSSKPRSNTKETKQTLAKPDDTGKI